MYQRKSNAYAKGNFENGGLKKKDSDSELEDNNEETQETEEEKATKELVRVFKRALRKITQENSDVTIQGIKKLSIKTNQQLVIVFGLVLDTVLESPAFAGQLAAVYQVLSASFRNASTAFISSCQLLLESWRSNEQQPITNLHE